MEDQQKKIIVSLLAYAAQRDISPGELCQLAGISNHDLQDPETRLAQQKVGDVWKNALRLSNDPYFGLHFGESLQLSALGIVGDIIKSSATMGEALKAAALIVPLITDAFKLDVSAGKDIFTITFIPTDDEWQNKVEVKQILDLLMAFVIHELDGLLLKKIVPSAVHYALNPLECKEYERVWRCKPSIGAATNSIVLDERYWNEPIITANYKVQQLLLEILPVDKKINIRKLKFDERIRTYLLENAYLGIAPLADIAANFNMSTRTLQRKLKEENINFHQITDDIRMSLAIGYLKKGEVPLKEICYLLGYNETSSFHRTFRRWTGLTPMEYIKSLKAG